MTQLVTVGASITMLFDIVGHNDETSERMQRSIEAISKDFRHVYLSDGSAMPVTWTDADGEDVEELVDTVYLIGGDDFLGYFSIAFHAGLKITEH